MKHLTVSLPFLLLTVLTIHFAAYHSQILNVMYDRLLIHEDSYFYALIENQSISKVRRKLASLPGVNAVQLIE